MIQGLSVLVICALIGLSAGYVLKGMERHIGLLPGLLVMVPPLLALRGNINGALASRLGTALHTGVIRPRLMWGAELKANIASSLILCFITAATIGALTCILIGAETTGIVRLMLIAIVASVISGLILAAITIFVAIIVYVKGLDPDNITSPAMTAIGDFVVVACIGLAIILVW